jgi:hypothetical protein
MAGRKPRAVPACPPWATLNLANFPRFQLPDTSPNTGASQSNTGPLQSNTGSFNQVGQRINGVVIDRTKNNLIHSCSTDKSLVTIDLKQVRIIIMKLIIQ